MPLPPTLGASINPTNPPTLRAAWPDVRPTVLSEFPATLPGAVTGLFLVVDDVCETLEERMYQQGQLVERSYLSPDSFTYERHGPQGLEDPPNGYALECYHRNGAVAEHGRFHEDKQKHIDLFDPNGELTESYDYENGHLTRSVQTSALNRWMMRNMDLTLEPVSDVPRVGGPSWYDTALHEIVDEQFPADVAPSPTARATRALPFRPR